MIQLRCLIVDDEPVARKGIKKFIDETPFLAHVGSAKNILEASEIMLHTTVDLLLLDIEMPGMNGIHFLKNSHQNIPVIIISAHPQFAIEGFNLDVIDYLLKPVSYDRFVSAINKARDRFSPLSVHHTDNFIFVKEGTSLEKINIYDIDYLEAKSNYLTIFTRSRSITTYLSIKKALSLLPTDIFIRTHKSFIINLTRVTRVESNQVWLYNKSVPISRNLKPEVISKLVTARKIY